MKHLVYNGFIQYAFLVGSILRFSRIGLDDGCSEKIRARIRSIRLVKKQIKDTDKFIEVHEELEVGPFRQKIRELFGCHWCLPFWITAGLIILTLLFPIVMTYINMVFATAFLVSVIYGRYA